MAIWSRSQYEKRPVSSRNNNFPRYPIIGCPQNFPSLRTLTMWAPGGLSGSGSEQLLPLLNRRSVFLSKGESGAAAAAAKGAAGRASPEGAQPRSSVTGCAVRLRKRRSAAKTNCNRGTVKHPTKKSPEKVGEKVPASSTFDSFQIHKCVRERREIQTSSNPACKKFEKKRKLFSQQMRICQPRRAP